MKKIMMKSIEERVKEAVHNHYNCNYPCYSFSACIFGEGENTAYDCEECGADEFKNGYELGATEQEKITKQEMIEKAKKAFCNVSKCGVPRDTCLRLGTCDAYDRFKKMLEEQP